MKRPLSADAILGNLMSVLLPGKSSWVVVVTTPGLRPTIISNLANVAAVLRATADNIERDTQMEIHNADQSESDGH